MSERLTGYWMNHETDCFIKAIDADADILLEYLNSPESQAFQDVINRLAAYEDTGLSPEQCAEVATLSKRVEQIERDSLLVRQLEENGHDMSAGVEKVAKWIQADEEGRMVVLPHTIGERAYRVCDQYTKHYGCCACTPFAADTTTCEYWDTEKSDCTNLKGMYNDNEVICIRFDYKHIPEFGKTIFATRAEAEAAMEGKNKE